MTLSKTILRNSVFTASSSIPSSIALSFAAETTSFSYSSIRLSTVFSQKSETASSTEMDKSPARESISSFLYSSCKSHTYG
ncbi:MAG: hypothetical protein IIT39_15650 [Clostridia bacterium]|nr:hypothetical protein [Clostridia bacterium]